MTKHASLHEHGDHRPRCRPPPNGRRRLWRRCHEQARGAFSTSAKRRVVMGEREVAKKVGLCSFVRTSESRSSSAPRVAPRPLRCLLIAVAVVGFSAMPASAHGLLKHATPDRGARVARVPRVVSVTLTQPPLPDGRLIVRDGCGRVVSGDSEVDDDTITAAVRLAQPGKWRVRFDFVSAADGHRYARSYAFTVAGRKDCTQNVGSDRVRRSRVEKPSGGDMASDSPIGHEPGTHGIPVGGLIAASAVALAVGVVSRMPRRRR
jgi:methionine-rich copper-binding protein CopC